MGSKSEALIAALVALFPNAFSAEPWRVHRPLKVGANDLVARGVLGAREVNAALSRYVDRLMYQKCLAAGGARADLDGNVAGEVSREQRCRAERLVARIKARQLAEAAAAKAEADSERALTRAALPPSILSVRSSSCRRLPKRPRPQVAVVSGWLNSSARRWSGGRPNVADGAASSSNSGAAPPHLDLTAR